MERTDLVISKAEKCKATAILNIKDYIEKANGQLQGNLFYQKLHVDPTAKHPEIANSATGNFRKQELLSNSDANKFMTDEVRAVQFHILPKVHEDL